MYTPDEMMAERIQNFWSSRDSVRLVVFGNSFLLINLNRRDEFDAYLENAEQFQTRFYGEPNPYFDMHATVAGVNHGIFFAMEAGVVIHTPADRAITQQNRLPSGGTPKAFKGSIHNIKHLRLGLLDPLSRVEVIDITELGELMNAVLKSQGMGPLVEKVRELLELTESELDLLY